LLCTLFNKTTQYIKEKRKKKKYKIYTRKFCDLIRDFCTDHFPGTVLNNTTPATKVNKKYCSKTYDLINKIWDFQYYSQISLYRKKEIKKPKKTNQ